MNWTYIAEQLPLFLFNLFYLGLIIGTIAVIVLDNRNPVKTIAWVLVLVFLPLVGLVFYLFFGRNSRKEKLINKKIYSRLLKRPTAQYMSQNKVEVPDNYTGLVDFLCDIDQAFLYDANDVQVYTAGAPMLLSLLSDIKSAKHHIHLEYFIFEDDAVGRLVRDALIDKAKEGVEIRVIYDDVGCRGVRGSFFDGMLRAGIEVRGFLKVRFPLFTSWMNYRNHRKIAVIDGKTGYIGGMNLAERYIKGLSWGSWRDTHARIEGKSVYGLQTVFLLDWYFVDQSMLSDDAFFPQVEDKGTVKAQIVGSDPVSPWRSIMQGLVKAITESKDYFYIQTPYFLPTEPLLLALQTAALAGVDVRLVIPYRSDSFLTQLGTRSFLADVLKAGVKVYMYKKGFIHSKLMVSDDAFVTIGSTNMDFRSFEHNFEVNAFMYDVELAAQMREVFLMDLRDSEQLFLKEWKKRPFVKRAAESVLRLLSPLL